MDFPLADAPLAYALLFVFTASSLYGLFVDQSFVNSGVFDLNAVRKGGQYHRVMTSAFLHADLGHLLLNGLTFFFFAPVVEYIFGTMGLLFIIIVAQLGAMGLTLYVQRNSQNYQSLGASGAISGVLVAFCVVNPLAPIYLFFALPIPAIVFAGAYIAYSSFAMKGPGRISHEAHLGGAIAGAGAALLLSVI